jgi:hypothetical protein
MHVRPVRPGPRDRREGLKFRWIPHALLAGLVLTLGLALSACGGGGSTAAVTPPDQGGNGGGEEVDPVLLAEIFDQWGNSPHNAVNDEPFHHWDADGEIPASCARCHSTPGFRDYIGDDGTAIDSSDNPQPIGTTINCDACHNDTAISLDHVVFPSGVTLTGLGPEARCMTCHQGRESTVSMNDAIAQAAPADDDTPSPDIKFRNVHYLAAGATLYGGAVMGAYQYTLPGPDGVVGTADDLPKYGYYDKRNPHVLEKDTCIECHNQHTLEVRVNDCAKCHTGVTTVADLRNVRMKGSYVDYDGDGNTTEGIYYEIQGLEQTLLQAIQQYATNVLGNPIAYSAASYPYWFADANANGMVDDGESSFSGWTARLVRAAYNYHYVQKEPGAFAHNPKYVIEFLYDSIADLDAHPLVTVAALPDMHRNDTGHFDAGAPPFRHFDADGEVEVACARCHSVGGFDFWAKYGIDITLPQPIGDGFVCEQCHVEGANFSDSPPELKFIPEVEFPSGVTVYNDSGTNDTSFVCISCHKGRESGATVEADIQARLAQGKDPRFRNIHYLAAGATLWGGDAQVGYEYPGKTYKGKWMHVAEFFGGTTTTNQCKFCHLKDHSFLPQLSDVCTTACHSGITDIEDIRAFRPDDYDGDGNATEKLKDEVQSFGDRLLQAMTTYEANTYGGTLTYDGDAYPYFAVTKWDAKLVRAAHNFQFWSKEPGAWAHNTFYIMELLYDSIEDIEGAPPAGFIRPTP